MTHEELIEMLEIHFTDASDRWAEHCRNEDYDHWDRRALLVDFSGCLKRNPAFMQAVEKLSDIFNKAVDNFIDNDIIAQRERECDERMFAALTADFQRQAL